MSGTLEREGFEDRLIPMLREAVAEAGSEESDPGPVRRHRSPTRVKILVLAATAVVVVAALLGGIAVGGRQVVEIDGREALKDPAKVEQQLRAGGIDASIVPVPLHNAADEGLWWWMTVDQPTDLSEDEFAHLYAQLGQGGADSSIDIENTTELAVPQVSGHVTLYVGQPVPAEAFSVADYDRMNELSPLGTFACLSLDANDPAAMGAAIEDRGYRIMWTLESQNRGHRVDSPPAGTVATWAWLRTPTLLDVRLAPAGHEGERYQHAEGTYPMGSTPPWSAPCD